ncbi:MAG TPA: sn-glycerol-1-phosphate dehydrogenase [Clostridiales bacterium]|nr:sn-glycerol-1-phosphate dehydrogenase [Clostridiales bacterium]
MKVELSRFNASCSCGRKHEISVKNIIIEAQAVRYLKGIIAEYHNPVFLCDSNTKKASQESMGEYFEAYKVLELEGSDIHADDRQVEWVQKRLPSDADVLVAVGSGTIHDITRYMAQERSIPFISVPTAASVDGFVSTVAAMTWQGMKRTIPAVAPVYVLADTDIFAFAPYRLTASGISDLMGKYTALLDWRVSSIVTGEFFCEQINQLELEALGEVEAVLDKIRMQDKESMEKLMYALILSGLAMQMMGNSRPASGAEHHVAHFWEMEILNDKLDALHGEKVSIGLLLCLEHYERLKQAITSGQCRVNGHSGFETEILMQTFGKKGLYEGVLEENGQNILETVRPEVLDNALPLIKEALEELPEAEQMREKLSLAGCVTDMKEIGLQDSLKELTLRLCPYVRRRLTLLRLSKMLDYPGAIPIG